MYFMIDQTLLQLPLCCIYIAAFFPFCVPGGEIVAPPPKRQRCDTSSELENHYSSVILYVILVITVFLSAFFKFESRFG